MGTQLSIDLDKLTCGELLRFADALRACGVAPDTPVNHAGPRDAGSYQLQVTLPETAGPGPVGAPGVGPGWGAPGPGGGPHGPGRGAPGPMRPISVPPVWSGPPIYPAGPFPPGMLPRREPATWRIRVSFPGGEWGRDLHPGELNRWRSALSEALASEALSETSQRGLMEIRDLFGAPG
jgi:hypothetical protein